MSKVDIDKAVEAFVEAQERASRELPDNDQRPFYDLQIGAMKAGKDLYRWDLEARANGSDPLQINEVATIFAAQTVYNAVRQTAVDTFPQPLRGFAIDAMCQKATEDFAKMLATYFNVEQKGVQPEGTHNFSFKPPEVEEKSDASEVR